MEMELKRILKKHFIGIKEQQIEGLMKLYAILV